MTECPICLSEIEEDQNSTKVHCCRQSFHTECYIKCGIHKNQCPLCRADNFIVIDILEVIKEPQDVGRFKFIVSSIFIVWVVGFSLIIYQLRM